MLCGNSIDCRGSWSSSQLHRLHPLLQCCPIRLEHAINEWWGAIKSEPCTASGVFQLSYQPFTLLQSLRNLWLIFRLLGQQPAAAFAFVRRECLLLLFWFFGFSATGMSVVQREVEVEVPVNKILSLMTFFSVPRSRAPKKRELIPFHPFFSASSVEGPTPIILFPG